jgi:hypothetical protein
MKALRRAIGCLVDQSAQRQFGNLSHVIIGEAPTHPKHRAAPFQKNIPAFGRERGGSVHDGLKLGIG